MNSYSRLAQDAWLAVAGIWFGASVSVKWNGLFFLIGAYGLSIIPTWTVQSKQTIAQDGAGLESKLLPTKCIPLVKLKRIPDWQFLLNFAVVPSVCYLCVWIPHLRFNTEAGFWQDFWTIHQQMLNFHEQLESGANVHPYCSSWTSWLMMWRPVAYFFQVTELGSPLPTGNSTLDPIDGRLIYDVHAMGNPVLWCLSTISIAIVGLILVQQWQKWIVLKRSNTSIDSLPPTEMWLLLFLALNYLVNLLPWAGVNRCLYLYHYMSSSVFATMALAWLVDRLLRSSDQAFRMIGIVTLLAVLMAFVFWLPVYLGLPLTPAEFRLRMLFPSWV